MAMLHINIGDRDPAEVAQQVATMIAEGYTSGYDPYWTLTEN